MERYTEVCDTLDELTKQEDQVSSTALCCLVQGRPAAQCKQPSVPPPWAAFSHLHPAQLQNKTSYWMG